MRYKLIVCSFLIGCLNPSQIKTLKAQSCPEGFSFSYRRFEKEIRSFETQKDLPKQAILFYGSSSIRMWETLKEDFAPLPVINRGFGGATLAEMNYYFRKVVVPLKPSVLVVYGGENDLAHPAYCMDSVQQRFRTLLKLRDRHIPQTAIVFILIKNSPKRQAFRPQFKAFNQWVRNEARAHQKLFLFDGDQPLQGKTEEPLFFYFRPDSLHLGPEGYRAWTEGLKPLLMKIYREQTETAP